MAPQARKIILRAAQRIKKVERRCVRAKEALAARKDGRCREPTSSVSRNVAIPFRSSPTKRKLRCLVAFSFSRNLSYLLNFFQSEEMEMTFCVQIYIQSRKYLFRRKIIGALFQIRLYFTIAIIFITTYIIIRNYTLFFFCTSF